MTSFLSLDCADAQSPTLIQPRQASTAVPTLAHDGVGQMRVSLLRGSAALPEADIGFSEMGERDRAEMVA